MRNQLISYGAALLLLFSSCKKDITTTPDPLAAEVISDDARLADGVIETAAPLLTPLTTPVNANCAGYYQLLPARYTLTKKNYPFILFIHGIGELGTNVTRLSCCGITYFAKKKLFPADFNVNGQHFSYIVMAPQFKVRPTPSDIQSCIDYAKKKYRIDPARIYISGLSMGGGSTLDYSAVFGQNVAAAVPVCPGTAPTTALAARVASANLPLWAISSKADRLVPISWATNWVHWIKNYNSRNAANIRLTTYTTESHNATWARAFNPATKVKGMNVYEWMLQYTRKGNSGLSAKPDPGSDSRPVLINAGADVTIRKWWKFSPLLNGTLTTVPHGWVTRWHWSKVSGPPSYSIAHPAAAKTRVSGLSVGTYIFRLTVTATTGAVASDDVKIVVLAK